MYPLSKAIEVLIRYNIIPRESIKEVAAEVERLYKVQDAADLLATCIKRKHTKQPGDLEALEAYELVRGA